MRAVAQSLIVADWRQMRGRADFRREQVATGLLAAMGKPDQRGTVAKS